MNPAAQGPETLLGRTLGGYRLNRLIGVGGTGAVFLALSPDGDATEPAPAPPAEVVVKVLIVPWQLTDEERADFQTRFEREAGILGRLHHPHIASILGYGDEDNLPYMVLPYFGGGSLATRLAAVTGGLSLEEAFSILNQIAGALDYIHHQGILHRDVKPGNILFDGAGVAYLSDFGIASVLDRPSTAVTATGQIIGTPAYMAPEQVQGAKSGVPSDIYGLGSVLYTMLTGHAPFEGTSLTAILVSKLQDAPPDPRALRPELPDPAAACVLKALARDPNQRFATAGDFAQAFGAGLQGIWAPGVDPIGILLPPPGTVARSAPWTALPGVPIPGATITAIPPRPTAKRATPRFFLWRMLAAVLAALARPFRRAPAAAPADIAARASTTMVSVSPASPWLSDETIFTRRQAASDAAVAPAFANATLLFPRGFAEDTRRLNLAEARAASQANLAAHRAPYAGVRVRSRDDLQLLLRDQGWSLVPSRARQPAADFAEADMDRIDLSALDVMRMNLRGVSLIRANLRGAYLTECVLREADLREADLRGAYLHAVNLRGANLRGADLSGCRLYHADLRGVDLRLAYMDAATLLKDCVLDTSIWVADVAWNNALLTQLDWSAVRRIADEAAARHAASRRERIQYYHAASRAYRGLTVALRQQGMVGVASGYRLREQALERKSLFLEGRILPWTFSWVLNVVGGYGERPGRALLVYLLTVFGFASAYALIGRGEGVHLPLLAALVYSVTSFHGRGFFPGAIPSLVDPLVWLAALEAVCGLFIELVFIATFSRRFLGS